MKQRKPHRLIWWSADVKEAHIMHAIEQNSGRSKAYAICSWSIFEGWSCTMDGHRRFGDIPTRSRPGIAGDNLYISTVYGVLGYWTVISSTYRIRESRQTHLGSASGIIPYFVLALGCVGTSQNLFSQNLKRIEGNWRQLNASEVASILHHVFDHLIWIDRGDQSLNHVLHFDPATT